MEDGVLKWAKRQHAEWKRSIALIEAGHMHVYEQRGEARKDTTQEALQAYRSLVAGLDTLIAKHEGQNA